MNDLDRYLLPTETLEVVARRHWASLAISALIVVGVILAGLFVLTFMGDTQFFAVVGVLAILGAIGWFGWVVGDWYVERFVITDKRVLLITGILTKRVAIMPLSKVTDLTYERSLLGRLLGYGVFVIESAGQQQALSRIDFLQNPDELYQQVSALLFGPKQRAPRTEGRSRPNSGGDDGPGDAFHDQSTLPLPPIR
ncbi:PH domain-containing protein [Jatrophihabitans sp. DSM 45814]